MEKVKLVTRKKYMNILFIKKIAKYFMVEKEYYQLKVKKFTTIVLLSISMSVIFFTNNSVAQDSKILSYSVFAEGGETESVFVIDGRNFPVRIGSFGVKAAISPYVFTEVYGKVGFGYSQKQSVSAYDYNLSGSVLANSFGGGATRKFPIGDSNFVIMPFVDVNIYNYSSDTFRGDKNGDLIKAKVKGNSSFLRGGAELQYLTQDGHFFFGAGLNRWDIKNEISIKTNNLTITPRVWADSVDSFLQVGVLFNTGNSDAIIGMRLSDLTFDINTQLVEYFAEVQVSFGKNE